MFKRCHFIFSLQLRGKKEEGGEKGSQCDLAKALRKLETDFYIIQLQKSVTTYLTLHPM